MILNRRKHYDNYKDQESLPSFEEFVNMELGSLFDRNRKIEQIIPNENATQFVIIYTITIWTGRIIVYLSSPCLSSYTKQAVWISFIFSRNPFIKVTGRLIKWDNPLSKAENYLKTIPLLKENALW